MDGAPIAADRSRIPPMHYVDPSLPGSGHQSRPWRSSRPPPPTSPSCGGDGRRPVRSRRPGPRPSAARRAGWNNDGNRHAAVLSLPEAGSQPGRLRPARRGRRAGRDRFRARRGIPWPRSWAASGPSSATSRSDPSWRWGSGRWKPELVPRVAQVRPRGGGSQAGKGSRAGKGSGADSEHRLPTPFLRRPEVPKPGTGRGCQHPHQAALNPVCGPVVHPLAATRSRDHRPGDRSSD